MRLKANVLFTWEIGQGLGHVLPILPVAREFKALGHSVTFALRDVRGAGAMLRAEGFTVLQAPFHPDKFFPANGPQPESMADVLTIFGFTSRQHLSGMRAAWDGMFQAVEPDLVIASYAPLSLLCARQHGIPSILLATPFELPIDRHPSPAWRGGQQSHGMDSEVIATVNAVFDQAQVSRVYEIFTADQTYLMCFPELDFFGPRAGVHYSGALFVRDVGIPSQWPDGATGNEPKVFVYLHADLPYLQNIRQAIHVAPMRFCVVLRDASPELLQTWRAPNVFVTDQMLRLDHALVQCDAVLNYGGAGLTSASLLAGKPIVCCLRQLEAMLNAQQVVRLGAGLIVHPPTLQAISLALEMITTQTRYAQSARLFASHYPGYSPSDVAKKLAVQALTLIDQRHTQTKFEGESAVQT